jgi:bacterioferritin
MAEATASEGILATENDEKREQIIELLEKAYWMEIETVMSYIANSVNPDGVRAQEIRESLQEDIQEELGDEQGHKRLFEGFLREYEAEGLA